MDVTIVLQLPVDNDSGTSTLARAGGSGSHDSLRLPVLKSVSVNSVTSTVVQYIHALKILTHRTLLIYQKNLLFFLNEVSRRSPCSNKKMPSVNLKCKRSRTATLWLEQICQHALRFEMKPAFWPTVTRFCSHIRYEFSCKSLEAATASVNLVEQEADSSSSPRGTYVNCYRSIPFHLYICQLRHYLADSETPSWGWECSAINRESLRPRKLDENLPANKIHVNNYIILLHQWFRVRPVYSAIAHVPKYIPFSRIYTLIYFRTARYPSVL